jgi:hypothetical protein
MSDWRTLEAGRELDRVVAERLGCKIVELDLPGATQWYAVFGPNGEPKIRVTAFGKRNEWPAYDMEDAWPAYSTDANAALALLTSTGCPWMVVSEPEELSGYRAFIGESRDDPEHMYYHGTNEGGDTVAIAIVRAWLAWSERGA